MLVCAPGEGLFLGNSMPIRDMDMYASGWRLASEDIATAGLGNVSAGVTCCSAFCTSCMPICTRLTHGPGKPAFSVCTSRGI